MNRRISLCIKALKKENLDALLVSKPVNITYLTGFRSVEGYLLLTTDKQLIYFTNFLYQEEAKQKKYWKVVISNGTNIFTLIAKEIARSRLKKVGFEAKHLKVLEHRTINNYLLVKGGDLFATSNLIENLRAIKTPQEISLIRKSAGLSQEAFEFVREIHDEDMEEKEMFLEIEKFLKLKGDCELPFPPIVASGKNSALPHYSCGKEKLNKNIFLIDLGSKHYGYCADLTRMFFWGRITPLFYKIYDIIKKSQELAIKKIRSGVKAKDIDRQARDYIEKKGYGKYFGHGLGHGVGLEVHEPPFINTRNETVLKEGMVLTIEPGIYLKGKFGVRIEDMVLVGKNKGELLNGNVHR